MKNETKNSSTYSLADMESIVADALSHQNESELDNKAIHIHIHSVRKRPTDPDGVSAKAAIDGTVEAGLLADDNCEIVKSVTFSQEKGKIEKTVIEFNAYA